MTDSQVDIKENDIFELSPDLLNTLLKDHTLSTDTEPVNIFWATDNYSHKRADYQYSDQITIEAITGSNGKFTYDEEASACLKYVKSKFARCMLGTLKAPQHNPKDTWANVPMQDFTENSDIDWSKSVEEIDAQLYAKYNLSDEELAFIESMIKPM